jgi:hypothetical protein
MEETMKVYGISNKETGEIIYVGRTCHSLEQRWLNHTMSSMYVKKYMKANGGFDKYTIETLLECESMQDMIDWESHFILDMSPICNIRGVYPPHPINWCIVANRNKRYKK